MLQVILNADDFGKSPGRNRAVDEALRRGLVTSAGLIVTGKHLPEAVRMIEEGGYAEKIHLHVNLSANLPEEDSGDIPLTDAMRKDPFFCKNGKFSLYHGLPRNFVSVFKWRTVYREMAAQYERFLAVTQGRGNASHIDFHLWYNLTWPVSVALRLFTRKYGIKSVRLVSFHLRDKRRLKLYRAISRSPEVRSIPATNLDYFLSKRDLFGKFDLIELYCHPNYKEGVLLDDSPSYLHHERLPLESHLDKLGVIPDIEFVSW